jgi:thymidylate kinase
MRPTKFLLFDSVDECGKTTFINRLIKYDLIEGFGPFNHVKELKFPKVLPSGTLLRINDEKSFELVFTLFEDLNPNVTYILDRFIMSNLVYDKVLRGEDVSLSKHYYEEFKRRFNVLEVLLTRPHITDDFIDDKIRMSRDQFNDCIDEYKKYGENYQLLLRDEQGKVIGTDPMIDKMIFRKCVNFVCNASI